MNEMADHMESGAGLAVLPGGSRFISLCLYFLIFKIAPMSMPVPRVPECPSREAALPERPECNQVLRKGFEMRQSWSRTQFCHFLALGLL